MTETEIRTEALRRIEECIRINNLKKPNIVGRSLPREIKIINTIFNLRDLLDGTEQ